VEAGTVCDNAAVLRLKLCFVIHFEGGGRKCIWNYGFASVRMHTVTSQKTVYLAVTALRTSDITEA
jgi:hypothetical protein